LIRTSDRASEVSKLLLDINAITSRTNPPYVFTSGWRSPVYVNCRKIISHVKTRTRILEIACEEIAKHIDLQRIDCIAGGETAGIPYAAWISSAFMKPMVYVRKRQKEFGLQERIVGDFRSGQTCLLVEDLNTDGASKIHFASVIRENGGKIHDVFCVFNYAVFPDAEQNLTSAGLDLLCLTNWPVTINVGIEGGYFTGADIDELRRYLADPVGWSRERAGSDARTSKAS
jgi:orotate phosphoribosyltransferase